MSPRYSNLDPAHRPHGARAILRWGVTDRLLGRRRRPPPGPPAPRVEPDLDLIRRSSPTPRLTWIGHASFLISLGGRRCVVDPVYGGDAGLAYRRHVAPGLTPDQVPPPDAVLVTHNHYDHLDLEALRAAGDATVVAPLGLGGWLRRRGVERVRELGWWESVEAGGLEVTLVPARHWSRRGIFDTNRTLWGGYVVAAGGRVVYHAGDTAAFAGFGEIGRRFPGLAAAMLPVGCYRPGWFMERQHLNPEQAGEAFLELGAHCLVPMHWGVFRLADEPLAEPAARIGAWWRRMGEAVTGKRLALMAVGETVELD